MEHPTVSYLRLSRLWPWPSRTTSRALNRPRDLWTRTSPKRKPVQNLRPFHPAPEMDFADDWWMMARKYPATIDCPGILVTRHKHIYIYSILNIIYIYLYKLSWKISIISNLLLLEFRAWRQEVVWDCFWESEKASWFCQTGLGPCSRYGAKLSGKDLVET